MLLCHMDEIGFLVSHISDKGYLYLQPVGGFDPRNLFSRRVLVCTDDGDFKGVMNPGGKPIHISSAEDRKKIPEVGEFYVDLGLGEAAKDVIKVGDFVVMDEPFIEIGDKFVSKALDNRIACWLGIEMMKKLGSKGRGAEIHVVFTTQEEVGLRGARTSAFKVQPDIGIGIDTTLACDTPGVPDKDATTVQGKGFGLHVRDSSFIADKALVREIETLAIKNSIPYQRTMLAAGGQDGAAAQQAAAGARAVGIVVGTRYIHTVTEMIHKTDLQAALDILAAYLADQ
jgi:putative aminopeptidase FrvX